MSRAGETMVGRAVWACPWCLVVKASGKASELKQPATPLIREPKVARPRRKAPWEEGIEGGQA